MFRDLLIVSAARRAARKGDLIMRKMQLAVLALGATVVAGFGSVSPAAARDYPWCAQGGELDYPGECAYQTYEQCLASVSGRLLYCGPNPRTAYGPPQQPPPRSRRRVAPY
jgi:hypothetical protein